MTTLFPTLVYRCPGEHQRPGGSFGFIQAVDESKFNAYIADGWFSTLEEAIAAADGVSATEQKRKYTRASK